MKNAMVSLVIVVVWLAIYVPACAVPRYRECRRVHPDWYCWMEQSR
jgi:hypothetical protein